MLELNKIYNMDCLEGMKEIPDKFFDLAIVDPPYGINAPKMSATPCQRVNGNKRLNSGMGKLKNRTLNNSNCEWDNAIPSTKYFEELFRVSKNQIIWGGNYFPLPPTRCVVVWDKVQPWENFSQFELAWTSFDSPAQLFRFDNRTGDKIHPTQKPVALYTWLLNKYAKKGDKILDTHTGSASSIIACYKGGFEYMGFEIDKDYYTASLERLQAVKDQISIWEML